MNQLSLFDAKPLKKGDRWFELFGEADPKLVSSFLKFNKDNPELYGLFKKFAFEAKRAGRKRFSIWMIANRIRWYTMVETSGKEFKVSNDYLACFARFLVWENPELEGIFQFKKMKYHRTQARN